MKILDNLDKDNLHHAYLIEGAHEEIVPEILKFIESLGIKTSGNPDFCHMSFDSFKIEDARNLKSVEYEKGFGVGKKIFLISVNNIFLDAQNTLLKIFEEPIESTHFFVITPNTDTFLKTLVSRFYLIKTKPELAGELKQAEEFLKMSVRNRIEFIKELLNEPEEDDEVVSINSSRPKALKFLNALEVILHKRFLKNSSDAEPFNHIFKVREFLNQPGSSAKSLMESVALTVPDF